VADQSEAAMMTKYRSATRKAMCRRSALDAAAVTVAIGRSPPSG